MAIHYNDTRHGERDIRVNTREIFDDVAKKVKKDGNRLKKEKKDKGQDDIALQTLKKNLNLEKDIEQDPTILQNTYNPKQGSPRFTKNWRRERESAEKVNINNSFNKEELQDEKVKRKSKKAKRNLPALPSADDVKETELIEPSPETTLQESKRKNTKGKIKGKKGDVDDGHFEDAEDNLLLDYQQQIAREEEPTKLKDESTVSQSATLNNDVGKKKKKKLKSVLADSDVGEQEESKLSNPDPEILAEPKEKRKKKKKKPVAEEENEVQVAYEPQRPVFDESLVLGVYIHRADRLKTDLLISHPMVKIHVVDEVTGQYVKKENCHRPVSSFYESESVEHILPIMTQPFDFKKHKSVIPEWQEQIIFNERFGWFVENTEESPRVILFFEILDFMSMEEARANVNVDNQERGFRKVAWAFLKIVGANGVFNIDNKLRLQLFCPPVRAKKHPKTIDVVEWWRKYPRHKYLSTLYVSVKGIKLPEHVDPSMRSMMALQEERGSTTYSELQNEVTRKSICQTLDTKPPIFRWSRLPGQVCRIPNKSMLVFRGGQMGCFTVLFSNAGTFLAAACADRDAFPVVVYEIPSGKVLAAFHGHLKIVYDLCWSRDDTRLLSASSDGTVREWGIERLSPNAQKVLPHPSFVYSAKYHPSTHSLVVTGGYDSVVRVWKLDVEDVNGQLLREFEGHTSFINTICFDSEGRRMFSADNTGSIIVWKSWVNDGSSLQPCQHWCIEKKIEEADLRGVPVNKLQLNPNGRCLLIHAKDSVLRMMDLRILAVKKYTGATNYKERIYSTLTPCGNFIFSGSEDGMAYVWNADTGDQVAVYSELSYPTALHDVCFHPHENMVAFCAFGQSQPIHVYIYDRKVSQLEVRNIKSMGQATPVDPRTVRNTPDSALQPDTPATPDALDQFTQSTRQALRMQSVKEQLDSVLEPNRRSSTSGLVFDEAKTILGFTQTGRSLTIDSGMMGLHTALPPPSLSSPLSKLRLSGAVGEQLIPQAALGTQNRGFTPVGQRLRASSLRLPRTLRDSVSSVILGSTDAPQVDQVVVALYDYKANRSDELTICRGDVIQVLYKDNENWWFGELSNGAQGYFLASYVVDEKDFSEEASCRKEAHASLSEGPADRSTPTRVSAAISSSGELRFLSELTLSDTEPELIKAKNKRKKKLKKPGFFESSSWGTFSDAEVAGPSTSTRRDRTSDRPVPHLGRPLPKRPSGKTNGAFEPDP